MRLTELFVALSLLATTCGGDTIELPEDMTCEPLLDHDEVCRTVHSCAACLGLDADGVGACRVGLDAVSHDELVTIVRWATSSRDECRAWTDDIAVPLADLVVALAAEGAFIEDDQSLSLERIKAAVTQPHTVGHPELEGLEVRMYGGLVEFDGQIACWGGLSDFLRRGKPGEAPAPTCCTEPGCAGVDYRCGELGPDGLVRACEPL